ncbi:hypothetical protein LB507_009991 [Fusarium sp. FIESC RH6]|nr:hypothetical protein LB507_009991 [Fusarium sp. FIESC RH6]
MPDIQTTIRKDHKKWKCHNKVNDQICGKINDITETMCECNIRRKPDTEALAEDDSVIGEMGAIKDTLYSLPSINPTVIIPSRIASHRIASRISTIARLTE